MFEDSYDIDISRIKNSDRICWEYSEERPIDDQDEWFEATGDMFCRLSSITQALATCSDHVHLDVIKPSNVLEWYYRLDALFDAGVGFLFVTTPEGEVPIRITINDIKDHIGLRIDVNNWETNKFDHSIRTIRMQNHLKELL
tara:strand:+ start:1730 stop:2155 length:426 start_codon:yes stop_codon:yes gene_type:complete